MMESPDTVDVASEPQWTWETVENRVRMERLAGAWDALARHADAPALAGADFALAYGAAFAPDDEFLLHVLRRDGEPVALVPLSREGRIVRAWTSLRNVHVPSGAFAVRLDRTEVVRRIVDHLLQTADYLSFAKLPLDGALCRSLCRGASTLGLRFSVRATGDGDTYLTLRSPWRTFERAMPRRLRRDVLRQLDKLHAVGAFEFQRITGGPSLVPLLEECIELETLGWKGTTGAPIKASDDTLRFYTELARRTSERDQFCLYVLKIDGRVMSFKYCLRGGTRLDSLKTSFDPAWAAYSPGRVLTYLVARQEIVDGSIERFHFGPPSKHKLRWASGVVRLGTVTIYGETFRGKLAYGAGPLIRGLAERLPGGRSAFAAVHHAVAALKRERRLLLTRVGKVVAGRRRARLGGMPAGRTGARRTSAARGSVMASMRAGGLGPQGP